MIYTLSNVSLSELCQLEGIESDIVMEIVEYGIVEPIEGSCAENWIFEMSSVHWIKKALRLYQDLEIDWVAVALLIDLMQQRESLQRENLRFQQQLQRFIQQ